MRTRRVEYSESTRDALVDSAVSLFTERGYAGTSLDEIAKSAKVTKGALYHHFSGKQALFEAAFDAVERRVHAKLERVTRGDGAVWDRAFNGLHAFLVTCLEPDYQRIVIHEAPVVMGSERWREAEGQYSYGVLTSIVAELIESGELVSVDAEVTARLLFGALSSAASMIAGSSEPETVSNHIEDTITQILVLVRGETRQASTGASAGEGHAYGSLQRLADQLSTPDK